VQIDISSGILHNNPSEIFSRLAQIQNKRLIPVRIINDVIDIICRFYLSQMKNV